LNRVRLTATFIVASVSTIHWDNRKIHIAQMKLILSPKLHDIHHCGLEGISVVLLTFIFVQGFGQSATAANYASNLSDRSNPPKASYVYNIAKLIDWPAKYKKGAFIIGYIGNPAEYETFARYISHKTIGNQRVYTTYVENIHDLPACHIMFIDKDDPVAVGQTVSGLPNNNTLVISRCENGLKKGATINLVQHKGNMRFELSEETAENHRLFIGSSLRGLAFNEHDHYEQTLR